MASTLWTILCKVCSMMVQEEERTSSESLWSIPERMLHVRLWSQERCSNMLNSWLMVRRISYLSVSVQLLSCVWFFETPHTAARQASLSITKSQSFSNSCPLSRWCHPTISSSLVPFSSQLQSFPALGSFPMSQFFSSGGQRIGVSASASVLPMNIPMNISFRMDWFALLKVQGTLKSLLQHYSSKA